MKEKWMNSVKIIEKDSELFPKKLYELDDVPQRIYVMRKRKDIK